MCFIVLIRDHKTSGLVDVTCLQVHSRCSILLVRRSYHDRHTCKTFPERMSPIVLSLDDYRTGCIYEAPPFWTKSFHLDRTESLSTIFGPLIKSRHPFSMLVDINVICSN